MSKLSGPRSLLLTCLSLSSIILSDTAAALPLDQLYEYPQYITGPKPTGIAIADFDNDGQLDFATSNYDADDVRVFRGLFYDKFRPGVRHKTSRRPTDIAVGDFNNDNVPDIATYNLTGQFSFSGVVSVLIGNGDTTFQPRTSFATQYEPGSQNGLFVRDFNNDGDDDIVTWTATGSFCSVTVHIGNGDGTFQGKRTTTLGINAAVAVRAFGNVDGNDSTDVLYHLGAAVQLRRGLGNGFFGAEEPVYSSGNGQFVSLTIGDITGDGVNDLVGTQIDPFGTDRIVLLEGDGVGGFSLIDILFRENSRNAVLADTDGDGLNDIVVSNAFNILVYKNLGGSFAAPSEYVPPSQGQRIAVADLNNDGRDDLLTILALQNTTPRSVTPMMSRPNGTLRRPPEFEATRSGNGLYTGLGDFNLDGALDIAVSSASSSELGVLLGKGNGRFLPRRIYGVTVGSPSTGIVVQDFNGDGRPDVANVVGGTFSIGSVIIRLAQANGALGPEIKRNESNQNFSGIASADFNEDGTPDLAISSKNNPFISVSGIFVALIGSSGGIPPLNQYDSLNAADIATGDFDGDDNQDIVVSVEGELLLSCLAGDGNGGFAARKLSGTNEQANKIAAGDVNADGLTDVVMIYRDTAEVHLSDGDCTFTRVGSFFTDDVDSFNQIELVDLDGDNLLDIVTTHSQSNSIMFLAGKGDGTFRSRKSFSTGDFPVGIATGDLNNDGKTDLAIGQRKNVSVLLQR